MIRISIIGCGAIGASVLEILQHDPNIKVNSIIAPPSLQAAAQAIATRYHPQAQVRASLDFNHPPDWLLECAGHSAITEHVLPALERGIACIVVSIGALSEPGMATALEQAAQRGGTQVQLLAGAIGGIDALAAARIGGLKRVLYTGRKPPHAWENTPAEEVCDLAYLKKAALIFSGSAAQAAQLYPKNANVAATLALAGLGLQDTQVQLWADPAVTENIHHVVAEGAFGSMELTMRGKPLASNPKTSALTVFSVVRAIRNHANALSI